MRRLLRKISIYVRDAKTAASHSKTAEAATQRQQKQRSEKSHYLSADRSHANTLELAFRLGSLAGRCFSSRGLARLGRRRSRLVAVARTACRHRTRRDKDANYRKNQRSKHRHVLCDFNPR